jgi:ubiquinone/menaquinone biosynthesis methyltransferase
MARFDLKSRDCLRVPEKKKLYNELHFAEAAPRYDTATRVMSLFRDATWKTRLVDSLPEIEKPLCVDIACGTGDVSFLLAQRYPEGRIVGLDIAWPMLGIARERNRYPNIRFVGQDMCAMEFPEGTVDIVTGSYALRNAPDLPRAIGEIRRILKPGGTAAFLDFSKPRAAIFRFPQYLILRTWCGSWGLILHGDHEIHGYIAESLAAFPDREGLLDLFAESGFALVLAKRFFLGITELLVFQREGP